MNDSDETLVTDAQRGNRPALEELVRRTSRLVYARLYLETGDAHQAEDLTQETYLQAFRALKTLQRPGQFRSWLFTIADNVLIDSIRSRHRQKRAEPPRACPFPRSDRIFGCDFAELASDVSMAIASRIWQNVRRC